MSVLGYRYLATDILKVNIGNAFSFTFSYPVLVAIKLSTSSSNENVIKSKDTIRRVDKGILSEVDMSPAKVVSNKVYGKPGIF